MTTNNTLPPQTKLKLSDAYLAYYFNPSDHPAVCGICDSPLKENRLRYEGIVCGACSAQAVNREGKAPDTTTGENPVWIHGIRCWRRYRSGGCVTMRDIHGAGTMNEFLSLSGSVQRPEGRRLFQPLPGDIPRLRKLSTETLKQHNAYVNSDSAFQQRLRLGQALWREKQGLPAGKYGNYIEMPMAQETLAGYLDDTIRNVVRTEVPGPRSQGKMYGQPRIFNNLLSSQPLCFNLFAHLQRDLELATRVFRFRCPDKVRRVTGIEFEWSPGRGNPVYTGDRSAFDVFIEVETPTGKRGFMGIEVKYHENLNANEADLTSRHEEVALKSGVFRPESLSALKKKPLEQIWRDHLVALSMLQADDGWTEGTFVYLAPRDNAPCANGVSTYTDYLHHRNTFEYWTLESLVWDIATMGASEWIYRFAERYLTPEIE